MEIVVLMAGEGQRFVKAGYTTPKPLIEVHGKTILEWTTDSILGHLTGNPLTFAIRSEHRDLYGLDDYLKRLYGNATICQTFDHLTRGNLETAFVTSQEKLRNKANSVLFLDSDNHYDGSKFLSLVDEKIRDKKSENCIVLCYFEPMDDSKKWCFCSVDSQGKVLGLVEKDYLENGKPMVGFFYWSSLEFFEKIAKAVLENEKPAKNEFYMSQAVEFALQHKFSVYAFKSDLMVPLGTPEDVERFKNDSPHRSRP